MTGDTLLITIMSIAAFGTVVLGLILRRIRHLMLAARRARRWPAVPGIITHSEIAEANHHYRLLVTYEYHVWPTPFRCARVAERAAGQFVPGPVRAGARPGAALEQAQDAARITALSVPAQLRHACAGDIDRVGRIVETDDNPMLKPRV